MADVSKRFGKGSTTNVGVNVYTVPEGKRAFIKALTLCNPRSSDSVVHMSIANTVVLGGIVLSAHSTITIPFLDQVFEAGEKINIFHSGSISSDFYISGREVDIE